MQRAYVVLRWLYDRPDLEGENLMNRPNRTALCRLVLAVGLCAMLVLTALAQPAVDVKELDQLIEQDAKTTQTILAKPKFLMAAQSKVKAAAMMIAEYAQTAAAKDNGLKYYALRDQALKLVKAAGEGKADEAKKLAAELSVNMKVDPGTKATPVELHKVVKLEAIMKQFAKDRFGGFNMEEAIENLVESKGPSDEKEAAKIAFLANKASMIARLARAYPQENQGKKTQKAWEEFSTAMHDAALELAKGTQDRKRWGELPKLADKLSMTCTQCHDVFRIKEENQ